MLAVILLDCALIGVCAVIRSSTVITMPRAIHTPQRGKT